MTDDFELSDAEADAVLSGETPAGSDELGDLAAAMADLRAQAPRPVTPSSDLHAMMAPAPPAPAPAPGEAEIIELTPLSSEPTPRRRWGAAIAAVAASVALVGGGLALAASDDDPETPLASAVAAAENDDSSVLKDGEPPAEDLPSGPLLDLAPLGRLGSIPECSAVEVFVGPESFDAELSGECASSVGEVPQEWLDESGCEITSGESSVTVHCDLDQLDPEAAFDLDDVDPALLDDLPEDFPCDISVEGDGLRIACDLEAIGQQFRERWSELETRLDELGPELDAWFEEFGPELEGRLDELGPELDTWFEDLGGDWSDLQEQFGGDWSDLEEQFGGDWADLEAQFEDAWAELDELGPLFEGEMEDWGNLSDLFEEWQSGGR